MRGPATTTVTVMWTAATTTATSALPCASTYRATTGALANSGIRNGGSISTGTPATTTTIAMATEITTTTTSGADPGFRPCRPGYSFAMSSLWLADRIDRPQPPDPLVEESRKVDVAVVGAGITGLITAVLLARAGKDVLVLEAHTAGAGATGNTTAKISLLQGSKMSKIVGKHGPKTAGQYVQ